MSQFAYRVKRIRPPYFDPLEISMVAIGAVLITAMTLAF
jgi:hypothetical protein